MSFQPLSHTAHVVDPERRWTLDWYNWLVALIADYTALITAANARVVTGSATFVASTTVAVTLPSTQVNTSYAIVYDSPEDNYFWTTSKTTTGFTANAKTSTSAIVRWTLIR